MRLAPFARFIVLLALIFGFAMGFLMEHEEVVAVEFEAHDIGYDLGYERGERDKERQVLQSHRELMKAFADCLERDMKCAGIWPQDAHPQ